MLQTLLRQPLFLRLVSRLAHGLHIKAIHTPKAVLVFSWHLVSEVLSRDNDFRVGPIYQDKMRGVAGDFFLGLDRCPLAQHQRDCGTRGMAAAHRGLAEFITRTARDQLSDPGPEHDVIGDFARPVACQTAVRIFGVSAPKDIQMMEASREIFHQTFLNTRDADKEVLRAGIAAGKRLRRWTLDEIHRRRDNGARPGDMLTYLLDRHELCDEDRATMIAGHLVGAIDTTVTAFGYIAYEILSRPSLREKVEADLDNDRRLRGWCYDILRRRPQAPLLPRMTGSAVELDGRMIPAETPVIAVTSAAHYDPNVFIDPDSFAPDRPMETYLHFGRGPHTCSGRAVNDLQLPILLRTLLKARPRRTSKLIYDGPFPDALNVRFKERV